MAGNRGWRIYEGGGGVNYTYDGDGYRVRKSTGTLYWLSPGGSILASTDSSGNIVRDSDYELFGQELWISGSGYDANQFAGMQERDEETGNDPTPNRMYASSLGRWLSPDPGGMKVVSLTDPQTWNMYAYTGDNPTSRTDPTGLCWNWLFPSCAKVQWGEHKQAQGAKKGWWESLWDGKPPQGQNTVTVEEVKGEGINGTPVGFNHAAISVNAKQAVGLEQKKDCGTCAILGETTPGAVKPIDPKRQVLDKATITITVGQANGIQTFLNRAADSPPHYNLYTSNCAQFCESALRAGGLKNVPSDETPHGLVEDLKSPFGVIDYLRILLTPPVP